MTKLNDALRALERLATGLLLGPAGAGARAWLATRGIDARSAAALRLGHHPGEQGLCASMSTSQVSLLREAGLFVERLEGCILLPAREPDGELRTFYGLRGRERPTIVAPAGATIPRYPLFLDRALAAGEREVVLLNDALEAAVLQAHGETCAVATVHPRLTRAQAVEIGQQGIVAATLCQGCASRQAELQEALALLEECGLAARVAPALPGDVGPGQFIAAAGRVAWRAHLGWATEVEAGSQDLRDDAARPRSLAPDPRREATRGPSSYLERAEGLFLDGTPPVRLANFTARIVADEIEDDGLVERRHYRLTVRMGGQSHQVRVAAGEFAHLRWVDDHLGANALIEADVHQQVRHAIHVLSGRVPVERIYVRPGWHLREGEWIYVHAAGALSGAGAVAVRTRLGPALAHFSLPPSPDLPLRGQAIAESLSFLELGPEEVTFPLFAAVWRALLGPGCRLWLCSSGGPALRSLLSVLHKHWGRELDLPGRHEAGPAGPDALRDALLVTEQLPTGEDEAVVLGWGPDRSAVSGAFVLQLAAADLATERLEREQVHARAGRHAVASAAFVEWAARRGPRLLLGRLEAEARELAPAFAGPGASGALSETAAQLYLALELFCQCAGEAQVFDPDQTGRLLSRGHRALHAAVIRQLPAPWRDPGLRLVAQLGEALAAGRAHVAAADGGPPPADRFSWGWRPTRPHGVGARWEPMGLLIGWTCEQELYLDRRAAVVVLRANSEGSALTSRGLARALSRSGLLRTSSASRSTLATRRVLGGRQRTVLHLGIESLRGERAGASAARSPKEDT